MELYSVLCNALYREEPKKRVDINVCITDSLCCTVEYTGFPCGAVVKNLPASAGDTRDAGSISGLGRFLEQEMATQSSTLAWKSMVRGAWKATVYGVAKSQT